MSSRRRMASLTCGTRSSDDVHEPRRPRCTSARVAQADPLGDRLHPRRSGSSALDVLRRSGRQWHPGSGTRRPATSAHIMVSPRSEQSTHSRRSGRPAALVLSSRVPFRIRTFCTGLMRGEPVSRIGHLSGNLHRRGIRDALRGHGLASARFPLRFPCGQRSDEFRPRQLSISESQPQSRTFDAMHTTGGDA